MASDCNATPKDRDALARQLCEFSNQLATIGISGDIDVNASLTEQFATLRQSVMAALLKDNAKKREVKRALRESKSLLAGIIAQSPVGVGVIGHDGRILFANELFKQYLPAMIPSVDRERKHRWRTLDARGNPIPPQQWPGARALRGESVLPGMEFIYTDDDGREHWLQVSATPLLDTNGQNLGANIVL